MLEKRAEPHFYVGDARGGVIRNVHQDGRRLFWRWIWLFESRNWHDPAILNHPTNLRISKGNMRGTFRRSLIWLSQSEFKSISIWIDWNFQTSNPLANQEPSNRDIKRWKICRFVWANKTGDYDPSTGRYDGAIGMLIDGLADSYYRPFDNGVIHPRFADIPNVPNVAEAISPSHLVKQFRQVADQQVIDQNLVESLLSLFHFLIPSASFLTFALVGCLVYWTVSWLFSKIQKSSLPSRRNLQMKIVSFFFMLFIFYIEQFTSNSLSTENLIVRTDSLLYSRQQILETKREFCFWEKGSGEMDLYKKVTLA